MRSGRLVIIVLGALACAPAPRPGHAPSDAERTASDTAASDTPASDTPASDTASDTAGDAPPVEVQTRVLEALDAMVRDGRLVLVEPDGAHVRAIDVESGAQRWRTPTGASASAAVLHDLGNGRALAQIPRRFVSIELTSGRVIASREAPPGWRFVFRNAGACALNGECDFTPIACEDARALAEPLRMSRIEFHDHTLGSSSSCTGERAVIGRAGDLSLYVVEGEGRAAAEVIAIDDHGALRWRSTEVACVQCVPIGVGVSDDGRTCWTTDLVVRELVVRAFECASGRPRFTRRLVAAGEYRHPPLVTGWLADPAGLVTSTRERVTLIAPGGRTLWERSGIPPGALAVPEALRVSDYPLALDAYDAIALLRATDGATVRTEAAGDGEIRVDAGIARIVPRGATSDRGGAPVPAPRVFTFERARSGSRALVGGRTALALEGDGWVLGEHRSERGTWLVIAEPREGRPDRLYILRAP